MSDPENDDEQPVGEDRRRPRRGKAARSPDDGRLEAGGLKERRTSKRERPAANSASSHPTRDGAVRDGDYLVGYGKPPKEHQFKKGQTGNRDGRGRESKDFATLLEEELDRRVEFTESGKRRKRPVRRIAARQLAKRAAGGDLKAVALILDILGRPGGGGRVQTSDVSAEDKAFIAALLTRLKGPEGGDED